MNKKELIEELKKIDEELIPFWEKEKELAKLAGNLWENEAYEIAMNKLFELRDRKLEIQTLLDRGDVIIDYKDLISKIEEAPQDLSKLDETLLEAHNFFNKYQKEDVYSKEEVSVIYSLLHLQRDLLAIDKIKESDKAYDTALDFLHLNEEYYDSEAKTLVDFWEYFFDKTIQDKDVFSQSFHSISEMENDLYFDNLAKLMYMTGFYFIKLEKDHDLTGGELNIIFEIFISFFAYYHNDNPCYLALDALLDWIVDRGYENDKGWYSFLVHLCGNARSFDVDVCFRTLDLFKKDIIRVQEELWEINEDDNWYGLDEIEIENYICLSEYKKWMEDNK